MVGVFSFSAGWSVRSLAIRASSANHGIQDMSAEVFMVASGFTCSTSMPDKVFNHPHYLFVWDACVGLAGRIGGMGPYPYGGAVAVLGGTWQVSLPGSQTHPVKRLPRVVHWSAEFPNSASGREGSGLLCTHDESGDSSDQPTTLESRFTGGCSQGPPYLAAVAVPFTGT